MTRIYSNLFEKMVDFKNLYRAYQAAAKGKRGQSEVAGFEFNLERNLVELQADLASAAYRPGGYRSFYIRDPKHRLISAAPFRDRVVHHALCQVIERLFERTFIADSYANRRKKGTHAALNRAQEFARAYPYVLQCDIRQFFPSIDHQVLDSILARKIGDERVLALCRLILNSSAGVLKEEYEMVYFPGDDLFAALRPRGLPIGNLTSQFWANVYLNQLDQFIKRELGCRAYLRYVDDFLLFCASKAQLWQWKRAIVAHLAGLRLTLHERESTVYPVKTGIPFLGFRIYPDHRLLKSRNGRAFARRYRGLRRDCAHRKISEAQLTVRVRGWIAHAAHGNTWGLRRSILGRKVV